MPRLTDYIIKMTEEVASVKGAMSSLADKVGSLDKRLVKIEASLEALPWHDVGRRLKEIDREISINNAAIKMLEDKDAHNAKIKRTFSELVLSPTKDTVRNTIKAVLFLLAGMVISRLLMYLGLSLNMEKVIGLLN